MAEKKTIYESQESLYKKAVQKMDSDKLIIQYAYKIENYLLAATMFEEVGDYLDAPVLAKRCRELAEKAKEEEKETLYTKAMERMTSDADEDTWKKLVAVFEKLENYKDSEKQLAICQKKVKQFDNKFKLKRGSIFSVLAAIVIMIIAGSATGYFKYLQGYAMLRAGLYKQATAVFDKMPGFLKTDEYVEYCEHELFMSAKKDNVVTYGKYQWKILEKKDGIMTLIAAEVDWDHDFYRVPFNTTEEEVTWKDSSLREWLNGEIYENGFSDDDKKYMLLQTCDGSVNEEYGTEYTEKTEDYLTLLSIEETEQYKDALKTLGLNYWLRTPGNNMKTASFMSAGRHSGLLYGYPVSSDEIAVRPIIKIDYAAMAAED